MKTMFTSLMNDEDRAALARVMFKRKKPASRADITQWMSTLVEKNLAAVRKLYREWKLNPGANQGLFPWLTESEEPDEPATSAPSTTPR